MQDGSCPTDGSGTSDDRDDGPADRWPEQRRELLALGRALRELRARRGYSQESLGFRAELHRNYIGGIERGELNITFRVLLKITHALHVPLSELIAMYERNRTATGEVLVPRERRPS
jgi:transcriptional regulator with XRE-family HTH domain